MAEAIRPAAAIALEGQKVKLLAARHRTVLANGHEVCISFHGPRTMQSLKRGKAISSITTRC
jgi:hypothetical protein